MAYASKYYDPVKAHEYYMRTRELKGYENRYGGSRGNGTSAASGGPTNYATQTPSSGSSSSSSGYSGQYARASSSTASNKTASERDIVNANINSQIKNATQEHKKSLASQRKQIQDLRKQFSAMSAEDKRSNRVAYMDMIREIERNIDATSNSYHDTVQSLKESRRGSSTSGFNEKGKAAAAYIKKQMEEERDEVTKKANKEVDRSMLDDVKKLRAEIQAQRESGLGSSRGKFLSRINSMTKKAKSTKQKELAKRKAEYEEKYISEIEKLRKDKSMHTYYDKRSERISKQENAEAKYQQRRQETVERIDAYNERKAEAERKRAEREARKAQRAAEKAARGTSSSSRSSKSNSSINGYNWPNSIEGLRWEMKRELKNSSDPERTRAYFNEAIRMMKETGGWDDETIMRRLGYR